MQDVPRMDNIVRTVKLLAKSIQVDTECEIPSPFFGSQMSSVQNSSTRRPASHSRTQNNPSGADGQSSQKLGDPVVNKVLKFTTGNVSNLPHQMGATLDPCQQETIQRESPPKDVPLVKVTNNAPLPAFPESTKDSTNAVADATNMVGCTLPRLTRGGSSNAQAITGDSAVFKSPTGRHSRKSTRGTLLANAKLAKHGRDMSPINENASCTEGTRSPSKTVMSTINSTTSKESTSPELVGITEVVAVSESTHTRQRQMQPRARMTRRSSKRGQDVAHDDTTEASLGDFDADMEQALKLSLLESSAGTTPRGMTDTTNSVSGSVTSPATSATATLMQAAQGGGSPGSATHGENTTLGAPSDVLDSSQTQGFELQVSPPLSPRERDAEPGALSCSVAGASGVTQKATAWIASDADKSLVDTKSDFGSVACSSVPLLVDHDLSDDDDESQEQMTNKKRKSRSHHGRAKRVIVDDDDDTDADDDDTGRTNHATSRSHDTTAKAHGSLSDAHKDLDGDDDTEDVGPRVHRTTRTSRARQIVFSSSSAGSGKGTDQTVTADDAALVSPLVRRTGDRRPASKHDNKRNALHRADSSHSSGSSSSGSLPDAGLERRHPAAGDCGALATDRARSAAASKMVLVHDSDGDDTNAHDSDSAHAIGTLRPVENRREPLEAPAKRQSRQTLTRHNAQLLRSKSSTASAAAEMLPSPGCSMPLISPDWQLSAAKSTDDDETASNGLHASRSGAAPHTTNASSVLLTPQGGSGKSEPSPKLSESPMDSEDSQAMLEKLRDIQRQAQQIGDLAPDDSMVQQRVTACVQMQPQYCDARVDNDSLAVATSSLVDPAPVSTHPQSLDMDDMGRATTPSSLQPHVLASAHAQHVPRTVSSPTGDTLRRTSQDDASAAKLTVTRLPTSRSQAQLQTTTDSERTPQSRQPHTPAAPHTSSPAANDVTPPARHAARGAGEGTASGMRARLNVSRMVPTPTKRVRDGPPVVLLTGVDLRADKHKWKAFQKLVTASNGTWATHVERVHIGRSRYKQYCVLVCLVLFLDRSQSMLRLCDFWLQTPVYFTRKQIPMPTIKVWVLVFLC